MRPRLPLRLALPVIAAVASAPACSAAPPPLPPPAAPAPPPARALLTPARYLVMSARGLVERTDDGIERTVEHGRRLELRDGEIVGVGPAAPELDGGGRAPAWAAGGGGAARYVFWKGKRVWGAETFLGPAHPLATLSQEPRGSFAWLDGTGLSFEGGALVVPPSGGAPARLGVGAAVRAVAADARRALVLTALGHAWLTVDAGASYRDVSADLGGATELEAREGFILATAAGGRERAVTPAGAIVDRETLQGGPWSRTPAPDPDPFFDATGRRPLDAAVRGGLPLGDGGVVIAARGFVGRFDLASQRATSVAPLDKGLRDAECTPVRAGGAVLLACVGADRAVVVDLDGAPRTERTFDLAGASDLDRFVAGDGALGFLGPCDGTPPRVPEVDPERGDPYNGSRQQSPVLCVRVARDEWVEHRLPQGEAQDLVAWIPRASGGAVALLSRPAPFLDDRERVQVRGALRVVRLARTEPPLSIGAYGYQRAEGVTDALRVLADDTITGWLFAEGGGSSELGVTIDPTGRARAYGAPPHARHIVHAGPLALASGDDGRLWETIDGGRGWAEVAPPPGVLRWGGAHPTSCSPAGCVVGGFARLGWTAAPDPPRPAPVDLPPSDRPARERYRRPAPAPAVVRLSCAPAGPPEGRRVSESGAFGYTPQPHPHPQSGLARLGSLGMAIVPAAGTPQLPATGDAELSWVAPLDVTGTVLRQTISMARVGSSTQRAYDLHLGYLLTPEGGLGTFAIGHGDACHAALLGLAGISRPLGACAEEPSVGVDLGGRILLVHPSWSSIHVSVAEGLPPMPPAPSAPGARAPGRRAPPAAGAFTMPVALHDIHETHAAGNVRGFTFGAGTRAGVPVMVVLDVAGQAVLAPIDPLRGTLGAEERLAPLAGAALGSSPACAARPGEARVVLPFEGTIALDRASLRGVAPTTGSGVAVLRWSRDRACLDAVELPVLDDRFDENPGPYEPRGTLRKIVARFDGKGQATLLVVGLGTEIRQRLSCTALLPGSGEAP